MFSSCKITLELKSIWNPSCVKVCYYFQANLHSSFKIKTNRENGERNIYEGNI